MGTLISWEEVGKRGVVGAEIQVKEPDGSIDRGKIRSIEIGPDLVLIEIGQFNKTTPTGEKLGCIGGKVLIPKLPVQREEGLLSFQGPAGEKTLVFIP